MFSKELNKKLDKYHLLNHPFYKSWNDGKLTREIIKDYAEQYYQHVKAFPRYISATHSLCEDLDKRKILLENLQDEENKDGDHPKLWRDFAFAMGSTKEKVESVREEKLREIYKYLWRFGINVEVIRDGNGIAFSYNEKLCGPITKGDLKRILEERLLHYIPFGLVLNLISKLNSADKNINEEILEKTIQIFQFSV